MIRPKGRIEELSIARLEAQRNVQYYQGKLREEEEKVKEAEEVAGNVQKEFEVRVPRLWYEDVVSDLPMSSELDPEGAPVLRAVGQPTQGRRGSAQPRCCAGCAS